MRKTRQLYASIYFKVKYPFVKRQNVNVCAGLLDHASDLTYNQILAGLFSPNTYFSEYGQDLYLSSILLNYIRNHSGAWIVDVGAGEPEFLSNSLYFETYYGCQTLAIDALEENHDAWKQERPNARFVVSAVGSEEGTAELLVPLEGDAMSSSIVDDVKNINKNNNLKRMVPLRTVDSILDSENIKTVMLLSIDVNGYELEVLKGIDFGKVEIKSIVLENKLDNLIGSKLVRMFLKARNYVFIARLGDSDDVFLHQSMINGIPGRLHQPATTI